MKRCSRLALWVCLVAMTPAVANAYYVESRANDGAGDPIPLRFDLSDGMPVVYRIAADVAEDRKAAIEAAFATWQAVECSSLTFMRGPDVDTPDPYHFQMDEVDRYILIYEDAEATLWSTPRVGIFLFGHDIDTSTVIGSSITINTYSHMWSTTGDEASMDYQSVLTALIGRSLGITTTMEGNATYPSYAPGDMSKRTLGEEDINALKFLYGDDTCGDVPEPEAICTGQDGCPPSINPGGNGDGGVGGGDGGTSNGGDGGSSGTLDAGGPSGTLDASATVDAGSGGGGDDDGDDDGCSCSAPGSAGGTTGFAVFLALGYVLTRRRRPRARS